MFARQILVVCILSLLSSGAYALVGKTQSAGVASRHTVMVLKRQRSGASFCSGVLIARQVVLTAAHCVHRAKGIAIYVPTNGAPKLIVASAIAIHPGYVPRAIAHRKRSIDLALVRVKDVLPGHLSPIKISGIVSIKTGSPLRIAGYGMQHEGVEKSAGKLRTAALKVRPPLSKILLWLRGSHRGISGACTGDSGGPVFAPDLSSLVAITVWARGKGKRRCGELTQAVLVAPQRRWIESILAKWGAR